MELSSSAKHKSVPASRHVKPLCTLAIYAKIIKKPAATTVSSLATYHSWLIAVAMRPVPRRIVPVFVMRPEEEGAASMSCAAFSAGGT
jgi:hypothetical protein